MFFCSITENMDILLMVKVFEPCYNIGNICRQHGKDWTRTNHFIWRSLQQCVQAGSPIKMSTVSFNNCPLLFHSSLTAKHRKSDFVQVQ